MEKKSQVLFIFRFHYIFYGFLSNKLNIHIIYSGIHSKTCSRDIQIIEIVQNILKISALVETSLFVQRKGKKIYSLKLFIQELVNSRKYTITAETY